MLGTPQIEWEPPADSWWLGLPSKESDKEKTRTFYWFLSEEHLCVVPPLFICCLRCHCCVLQGWISLNDKNRATPQNSRKFLSAVGYLQHSVDQTLFELSCHCCCETPSSSPTLVWNQEPHFFLSWWTADGCEHLLSNGHLGCTQWLFKKCLKLF